MDEQRQRDLVIEVAKHYLGRFYIWGGDDPSGFDCSGFVIECLKSVGVLPRTGDWTAERLAKGFAWASVDLPRGGDLVFWNSSHSDRVVHVEICLNDLLSIGASGGGRKTTTVERAQAHNAFIKIRPMESRGGVWGYKNPYT